MWLQEVDLKKKSEAFVFPENAQHLYLLLSFLSKQNSQSDLFQIFILDENNSICPSQQSKRVLPLNCMQWCFIVQTILGKCLHHIIDGWDNVIILCFQNEKVNRDVVRTSPSLFWPALFRVKTHIQMLNANGNMCYCNEELQSDARVYSQENSSGRRK